MLVFRWFCTFAELLHCRIRRTLLIINQLHFYTGDEEIETKSGYVIGPKSHTTVQISEWSLVCVTLLAIDARCFHLLLGAREFGFVSSWRMSQLSWFLEGDLYVTGKRYRWQGRYVKQAEQQELCISST